MNRSRSGLPTLAGMLSSAAETLLKHAPPSVKRQWAHRINWATRRHAFQVPPAGDWDGWMLQAGRGAGKTRTGAEDCVEHCLDNPGYRYAVVAPTAADARDIAIEGESGILYVLGEYGLVRDRDYTYNRSLGELVLANKALISTYSAEKPDRLRGPQHHRAWCEELASWKDAHKGDTWNTTYNNLMFGLRLGDKPRHLITTTPRRVALVAELVEKDRIAVTRGTTYDNIDNLAAAFRAQIMEYEGSTIGRQEILGELLTEVEDALWSLQLIERYRITEAPELKRIVVAVDPPGGATEAGIVVAGLTAGFCVCDSPRERLPHVVVLEDASLHPTGPDQWGRRAISAFDRHEADRVIGEVNYGGDMVQHVIRGIRSSVPYSDVRATRGKQKRAEPVAALYEQGRVHHVGMFGALEDEMTTWTPDEPWSPNRLDALVWAVTELAPWKKARVSSAGMDLTSGLGKSV